MYVLIYSFVSYSLFIGLFLILAAVEKHHGRRATKRPRDEFCRIQVSMIGMAMGPWGPWPLI